MNGTNEHGLFSYKEKLFNIFWDAVVQLMQRSCMVAKDKSIVSVDSTPYRAGLTSRLGDDGWNKWYTLWKMTLSVKVMGKIIR